MKRGEDFNGHAVWLDEANQTVYMESCDDARAVTAEGSTYGPKNGVSGWAFICPS